MSEMDQKLIIARFDEARRISQESGLSIFTKQIDIFSNFTSIAARIAALLSLTSRNSWSALGLTIATPIIDYLLRLVPWKRGYNENRIAL
jgi:hypothetical protein